MMNSKPIDYIKNILTYEEIDLETYGEFPIVPILVIRPHTIEHATTLWSYVIEQAINDTEVTISKTDSDIVDSYVVSDRRNYEKYSIIMVMADKNEVFNKLSDEHQCWLILNNLM